LNSDAIKLGGLIETMRGVWIIEDDHPVTDPYEAHKEASFSLLCMLKSEDTVVNIIPGWKGDSGKEYKTYT
jgi:hypothetical protein